MTTLNSLLIYTTTMPLDHFLKRLYCRLRRDGVNVRVHNYNVKTFVRILVTELKILKINISFSLVKSILFEKEKFFLHTHIS